MAKQLPFLENRLPEDGNSPEFKVVILYEDQDAALMALQAYRIISSRLEGEFEFTCDLWRLDVLEISDLRPVIEESLQNAQSVLLATESWINNPPASLPDWVRRKLDASNNTIQQAWIHPNPTNQVVFEPIPNLKRDTSPEEEIMTEELLRNRFHIVHPIPPGSIPTGSLQARARVVSGLLDEILHASHPPSRPGLGAN